MAGETILVVEDEPLVGAELQELLMDLGYSIPEVVDDGSRALEAFREYRPDLILMDIRIKGSIDGVETAAQIRQTSGVPIIFVTAYSDPAIVARVAGVRPDGLLFKPFQEHDLEVAIAGILERRKGQAAESPVPHEP
jgi:CheY-like chemotaxis protein